MADQSKSNEPRSKRQGHDAAVHSRIGDQLKAFYDEVLTQPVPDRFEVLLRRLDQQGATASGQEQR